jgi:hypothetical protein
MMLKKTRIETLAVRAAAQRIAKGKGRTWKDLPLEEREALKQAAQGQVNEADQKKAVRQIARKLAKTEGQEWEKLSIEERQSFIAKVRSAA